jgi:hypothetical protein
MGKRNQGKKPGFNHMCSGVPESMTDRGDVKMKLDIHGTPAENLQRLITECGMSPHKVSDLGL